MNECTTIGRSEKSSLLTSATEDDFFVAEILLDLPNIIRENESCPGFDWGSKKRRSRMDEGASSSRAPSSLSPSFKKTEERKSKSMAAEEEEAAAGSPVTPLPSGSHEKNSRHAFKKSSRKREVGNVTKYYNKLNAYNSELKAMKQVVLNSCLRKKEPGMEINIGKELTQKNHHQVSVAPHQQPLAADHMAEKLLPSLGPVTAQFYSSYFGLGSVHGVGPLEIPDLNISALEAFVFDPLDASRSVSDRRARFAEARRMRKGIIKIKSMRRACGIRLSGT